MKMDRDSGRRRVLMVSYFFPPYDSTAAVEALKFASYLRDYGWDPTIISTTNDFPPTLPFEDSDMPIERTRQLDLNWPVKKLAGTRNVSVAGYLTEVGTVKGRLMARGGRAYRNLVDFPDGQVGWYPFAIHRARKIMKRERFDAILSSAYPVTNHLVARRAARITGIPWLADFRDLWTANHYFQRTRLLRPLERAWEAKVLSDAAALSAPSAEWASLLQQRFHKTVTVVPNAFDPADYPATPEKPSKFTLTYTGVLYPRKQDADPLLHALAEMKRRGEVSASDFELRLVGRYVEGLMGAVRALGIEELVSVGPSIPHRDALALQKSSTALLFLSWMHEEGKGWYSAKIYEYIGAGKPILVLGASGVAADLVRELDAGVVVASTEEVLTTLSGWIKEFRTHGDVPPRVTAEQRAEFEWRPAVGKLAAALDTIASARPSPTS